MVVKEFLCTKHGLFDEYVVQDSQETKCSKCKRTAKRVFFTPPQLTGEVRNHFNPHYDEQVGEYFSSYEEKKAFLKKTGRTQISGQHSPRKSNNSSFICTKEQAKQFDARLRKNHG